MEINNSKINVKYLSLILREHNGPGWFRVVENGSTELRRPFRLNLLLSTLSGKHVSQSGAKPQNRNYWVFKIQWLLCKEWFAWLGIIEKQKKGHWDTQTLSSLAGVKDQGGATELQDWVQVAQGVSPRRTDGHSGRRWDSAFSPFQHPVPLTSERGKSSQGHWPLSGRSSPGATHTLTGRARVCVCV